MMYCFKGKGLMASDATTTMQRMISMVPGMSTAELSYCYRSSTSDRHMSPEATQYDTISDDSADAQWPVNEEGFDMVGLHQ